MSFWKKAWGAIKKASHSPIVQGIAGVACVVVPAAGIPAMVALTASNKILAAAEAGNAKARQLIANTKAAAQAGHVDAVRGWKTLQIAQQHRSGNPAALRFVRILKQKHEARQTAARRVAARYRVHPKTGRLIHA